MSLTYRDVREILEIVDAGTIDELVLKLDGARLVVHFHRDRPVAATMTEPAMGAGINAAPRTGPRATPPRDAASEPGSARAGRVVIRSPMVGTFYRAPSPGEASFVELGDTVEAGDPLGMIEVMKLYTTIEAERPGRIVEIPAASGTLVERDQILFVIEPVA